MKSFGVQNGRGFSGVHDELIGSTELRYDESIAAALAISSANFVSLSALLAEARERRRISCVGTGLGRVGVIAYITASDRGRILITGEATRVRKTAFPSGAPLG
jgi:hypothetical protein